MSTNLVFFIGNSTTFFINPSGTTFSIIRSMKFKVTDAGYGNNYWDILNVV